MPFTKQYFHLRDLQKSGKTPQFGSFKYSAQDLYERGILLSIDQYSPRQFDKIDLVISSNQLGVFAIEMFNNALGITNRMANADVRLEDLLQAQYQDRASLSLFNGLAKFNLNLFLYQINKKWVYYHHSVYVLIFFFQVLCMNTSCCHVMYHLRLACISCIFARLTRSGSAGLIAAVEQIERTTLRQPICIFYTILTVIKALASPTYNTFRATAD